MSPEKRYRDIVPDYATYVEMQTSKWASSESESPLWNSGQVRYLEAEFSDMDRNLAIADIACGDGVGLRWFAEAGFSSVVGVELNPQKAEIARRYGFEVHLADMHQLDMLADESLDVVYSSHTLEHAFEPSKVVAEFRRVMKKGGLLRVVLPYPDTADWNDEAHGGKYEIGTNIDDGAVTVRAFFDSAGFDSESVGFDQYREPEVWLSLVKR